MNEQVFGRVCAAGRLELLLARIFGKRIRVGVAEAAYWRGRLYMLRVGRGQDE